MKLHPRKLQGPTRSELKAQLDTVPAWRGKVEYEPIALYVAGSDKQLTDAERKELIARVRAGEVIELELDAVPFIQRESSNRNAVRFKPGMLAGFAKSYKGAPFLRNHDQEDQAQRGGTVSASKLEHNEDGSKQMRMRLKLVKPWAVESALDGTLDRFSIGWHRDRTQPLECSSCADDWMNCSHWPGELDEKGAVVQLVIAAAEGTEVSAVNVPAVVGTSIESISTLKAIDPAHLADMLTADAIPGGTDDMKILATLAALLALPSTATEDDVVAGVSALRADRDKLTDQLTLAKTQSTDATTKLAKLEADAKTRDTATRLSTVEGEITKLLAAGKIKPGSDAEGALRRLGGVTKGDDGKLSVDLTKPVEIFASAVADLLAMPSVTPVGAPLPAKQPDPTPAALTTTQGYLAAKPETAKWLSKAGIDEKAFEKHGDVGREIAGHVFGG